MINKIIITTALLFICCFGAYQQSTAYGEINKKEADLKLTEMLLNYRCDTNILADSIYHELFQAYTDIDTLNLSIIHRRYGSLPPVINIPMKDFLCLFYGRFQYLLFSY